LKSLNIYKTSVQSSINSVDLVEKELISNLQSNYGKVNDCTLFELKVIINEILKNAIGHGNREESSKCVKVSACVSMKDVMVIVVEDEGCGYDYSETCRCRKPCDEMTCLFKMSECGRGIMLIRALCDTVKVNAKGNKIVVAKSIFQDITNNKAAEIVRKEE